jgi:hypothetical protein
MLSSSRISNCGSCRRAATSELFLRMRIGDGECPSPAMNLVPFAVVYDLIRFPFLKSYGFIRTAIIPMPIPPCEGNARRPKPPGSPFA